jgi:hypothetical protein
LICDVQTHKEKALQVCANTNVGLLSIHGFLPRMQEKLKSCLHLPVTLHLRHSITTHLLSIPSSVMSTIVGSVTNNLESTNNLAHCEETQKLGSNYGSRYQLGTVDVSERFKEAL